MKDYIKPTFTLAGLFPVAFAATCPVKIKGDDLVTLYEQLGIPESDYGNTFAESEGCTAPIPDGLTQYCKFTSTGTEAAGTVLTS